MNYIELLNRFYEYVQCSRVSNNAQLLYYTLLAINNKCSWSDWFSRTNVNISGMMGVSEKAFIRARAELKQDGLIDFIPSKKRGECTKYRILYQTNDSTKEGTTDSSNAVQTPVQSTDINKLKQKQNLKSNTDVLPENSPEPKFSAESFEMRCVDRLINSILEQLPGAKVPKTVKAKDAWAVEIDRMKRLDKRSEAEILEALEYAMTDPFWKTNILSTAKLREKYEKLILQARKKGNAKGDQRKPGASTKFHNFEERKYDYDAAVWGDIKNRYKKPDEEGG